MLSRRILAAAALIVFIASTGNPVESASNLNGGTLDSFQYISPMPNSQLVSKETNIIIRPGNLLPRDRSWLADPAVVEGSISGYHKYTASISDDQKTIVIQPDRHFIPGEIVTVTLNDRLAGKEDKTSGGTAFSFTISPRTGMFDETAPCEYLYDDLATMKEPQLEKPSQGTVLDDRDDTLPLDFPGLNISVNEAPDDGYVFIAKHRPLSPTYLLILDNSASPIFYRKLPSVITDFKKQTDNLLSYYAYSDYHFSILDTTYTKIDQFSCGNGYAANHHDFQMIDSGHVLLIAYDTQVVDMSLIVPGGNPDCFVTGLIVQELDAARNVVFQWRSWDHFQITDATHTDFTANRIDYVHGNAVELDNDGNILISSRHLDEITKINRQTGDIIWRLGGQNNQFTFANDSSGFNRQHDIRRLPNGNITLFDNGNWHTPQYSRAVEYSLDETNRICTLVWEYRDNPDRFGAVNGSVQRLPNGNTMIGWGGPGNITLTEVGNENEKEFELSYISTPETWSYRAFRFPWRGKALIPYLIGEQVTDHIHLVFNKFGDTSIVKYYIYMIIDEQPVLFDSTENCYMNYFDLTIGQTYEFRVTALDNQSNESPYSNEVFVTMPYYQTYPYMPGDANMVYGQWPPLIIGLDVTLLIDYFRNNRHYCMINGFFCAADANGDCVVIGSDISRLVNYLRGAAHLSYCPEYPPAWLRQEDIPAEPPPGWPGCE